MRRIALLAVCLCGLVPFAGAAFAHGDQYRDPRPGDAPLGPPPEQRPPAPPPLPPGPQGRPVLPAGDWFFWWQLNAPSYEHVKHAAYRGKHARGLFVSDDRPDSWDTFRLLRKGVREVAHPALRRVLDPDAQAPPHVVAAALLALGKVGYEASHARVLLDAASARAGPDASVEEAACLALGLLRRLHPADQRSADLLDEARALLLACLEDVSRRARTRAAAAIALGWLADQPATGGVEAHRRIASRLLVALDGEREVDVRCAVLWALGRQAPEHVGPTGRGALRSLAARRRVRRSVVDELPSAWALTTLGRVGTLDDAGPLGLPVLYPHHATPHEQRGAALGLGALGVRLVGAERARVVRLIRGGLLRVRGETQRGLLLISLGRILAAATRAGETSLVEARVSIRPLLRSVAAARGSSRGFAALALGHVARSIGEDTAHAELDPLRREILDALRRVAREGRDARLRAAAALGLGIARDREARRTLLVDLLQDEALGDDLRASAAWAVGLIGEPTASGVRALEEGMRQTSSFELRRRAVRALALLGHPSLPGIEQDAVRRLLEDLQAARSVIEQRDTLVLLARFGDHRALEALAAVLADPDRPTLVRALAASALGAVGDTEDPGALDLLRRDVDPLGSSPGIRRILRYL